MKSFVLTSLGLATVLAMAVPAGAQTQGLGGTPAASQQARPQGGSTRVQLGDTDGGSLLGSRKSPLQQAEDEMDGKPQPEERGKVVGGVPARDGAYPFMVNLFMSDASKPNVGSICGATWLGGRWLLTAAHCVTDPEKNNQVAAPQRLQAFFGSNTRGGGQRIAATRIVVHPQYSTKDDLRNDIALIQLQQPPQASDKVGTIRVPSPESEPSYIKDGMKVRLAGWGTTQEGGQAARVLMTTEMEIIPRSTCNANITRTRVLESVAAFKLIRAKLRLDEGGIQSVLDQALKAAPAPAGNTTICVGLPAGGRDACQGDSGGPVFVFNETSRNWIQVGLVSWGEGCARPNLPTVYTRITPYIPWIQRVMSGQ